MWKARLYTFLFRRILGPYLTPETRSRLHESLNVSFDKGKLELSEIDFNGDAIASKLGIAKGCIKRVYIRKLCVTLSLVYNDEDGTKAGDEVLMKGARLVVSVDLDQVDIELVSDTASSCKNEDIDIDDSAITAAPEKGAAARYIEGIINSMKLHVTINNVSFRISSVNENETAWVALTLSSLSYRNSLSPEANDRSNKNETQELSQPLSFKELTLGSLVIEVGGYSEDGNHETSEELISIDGDAEVQLITSKSNVHPDEYGIDHDWKVTLNQEIFLNIHIQSLIRLVAIGERLENTIMDSKETKKDTPAVTEIKKNPDNKSQVVQSGETVDADRDNDEEEDDDDPYIGLLSNILRDQDETALDDEMCVKGTDFDNDLSLLDDFFDTNGEDNVQPTDNERVIFRIFLYIKDASVKTYLNTTIQTDGRTITDVLIMTIAGFNLLSTKSNDQIDAHISIQEFDIEDATVISLSCDEENVLRSGIMLRFLEVGQSPSSHNCLSLELRSRTSDTFEREIDVEATIQPLELGYRQKCIDNISQMTNQISDNIQNLFKSEDKIGEVGESSFHFRLMCSYLIISISLEDYDHNSSNQVEIDNLFSRCGYRTRHPYELYGPIGLFDIYEIKLDISRQESLFIKGDSEMISKSETKMLGTFQKSVISVAAPTEQDVKKVDFSGEAINVYKFDILTIESETKIDPDALVKIEFISKVPSDSSIMKKKGARKYFPLVTPLSSIKTTQQLDSHQSDDEKYDANNDVIRQGMDTSLQDQNVNPKRKVRGSNPQTKMLRTASCCTNLSVHVPSIAIDMTIQEKETLIHLCNRLSQKTTQINDLNESGEHIQEHNSKLGIALSCDQVVIAIHDDKSICEKRKGEMCTILIIFDGIRTHCVLNQHGLSQFRVLSHDLTLYEAFDRIDNSRLPSIKDNQYILNGTSIDKRCAILRKRRRTQSTQYNANAVFFRSKLSLPLSPSTPAFIVDMINHSDVEGDKSVYISFYDMTYRHRLESDWVGQIKKILAGKNDTADTVERRSCEEDSETDEATITNLFMTVTDCNLDYTSPAEFQVGSRSIIRLGELHLSSNIIIPAGPIQTFKLSLSDIGLYLSNTRSRHNVENSRISFSNFVLRECDLPFRDAIMTFANDTLPHSLSDPLFQLNFILIGTLDCLDVVLALSNNSGNLPYNEHQDIQDYVSTLTVTTGKLYLHTCKDSFTCFADTLNELVLKLTMPSEEELQKMKMQYANQMKSSHMESDTNISKAIGASIEDAIECDLFGKQQNLDTVDEDRDLEVNINDELNATTTLNMEQSYTESSNVITDFYALQNDQTKDCAMLERQRPSDQDSINNGLHDVWTTVDHVWSHESDIPDGEEQIARWYTQSETNEIDTKYELSSVVPKEATIIIEKECKDRQPNILPRHVPINPVSDPLSDGDMGASNFAGSDIPPVVNIRVIVKDMSVSCCFFDGYDWNMGSNTSFKQDSTNDKNGLMGELLDCQNEGNSLFENESKMYFPKMQSKIDTKRRTPRQQDTYFQLSLKGMRVRMDSFEESNDHHLASCMNLTIADIILTETISGDEHVKLIGEWRNEEEHPRDSNDGLLMMKMVTMNPENKFSTEGNLMGNESRVTVDLLPLRFLIHQSALRYIRQFFGGDGEENDTDQSSDYCPPQAFFRAFKVKSTQVKVDYKPFTVDTSALKDGSYIELLNLLPLEDMILRLAGVELRNLTGWGSVLSELTCAWLQDVSSTQMHKFLTRTSPVHPFANVGDGMKKFVMFPLEEYKQTGNVRKGLRKGTSNLAGTVAYESLTLGAKITDFAAKKLSKSQTRAEFDSHSSRSTPLPRNMGDASGQAIQSLSRGLKEANAKVIIMPYREYQKTGTRGAVKSVVKGIPVAVCANLQGAAEAVSYGLYGFRNQLRPDLREEEEASARLHNDF